MRKKSKIKINTYSETNLYLYKKSFLVYMYTIKFLFIMEIE